MARRGTTISAAQPAQLSQAEKASGIQKLQRRIKELDDFRVADLKEEDYDDVLEAMRHKIDATLVDVFGAETIEHNRYRVYSLDDTPLIMGRPSVPLRFRLTDIESAIRSARQKLRTAADILVEQIEPDAPQGRDAIKAFANLDLHPAVGASASSLFQTGHYAEAIENAIKAVSQRVRDRTGLTLDGTQLMERAFSATNPILRFNLLADRSDQDEQRGYMMLFSGAVTGIRNPRSHRLAKDDPERAIEFIGLASLLAKLVDEAERV